MKPGKTIVITGSHHTPAIELIHQLEQDPKYNWRIFYLGHIFPRETHIQHTIIPQLNVNFTNLESGKFDRHDLVNTLFGIPKTVLAVIKTIRLLQKNKANVVVSFGGYVSVPVIMAAYFCKIPSITHEQTHTISLSTKINSFFVKYVALSFNSSQQNLKLPKNKVIVTGNLLRREIFQNQTTNFKEIVKKIKTKPLIYITGGNQGSLYLNQLVTSIVSKLNKKYLVIHQTGSSFVAKSLENYLPVEFVESNDIGWVLNNCQLIISRAGANICQEIELFNIPRILIPLPDTQQNEQLLNARWLSKQNPQNTIILDQMKTSPNLLLNSISKLINHRQFTKVVAHNQTLLLNKIHEISI